jgi:hypothetical protein
MGMGFWNRKGKGKRGAGTRRCRLPPLVRRMSQSCPFPHWRFVAPKMAPSHPRKVRPYHGCVLIYLHLRTNGRQVLLWSQKLGFLLGHIRIQDQKKLEALGTTMIVPRWFHPLETPSLILASAPSLLALGQHAWKTYTAS